ncbi:MAG: LacI family DNA-binding transcriptional regulator [Actinomycetaceae bacterium]|nr:LacI family DNA-binding transcriptional regulator [Actinomycetaceae bacterium]
MSNNARQGFRSKGGVSIADVARLAGVSSQTVSRVSNGSDQVRPETRDKVIEAMRMLGYSPNIAARALRQGEFKAIGVLGNRFDRTGESLTTSALIAAATAQDYAVTIVTVQENKLGDWDHAAIRLSSQAIDGLVILRAEHTPEQFALPAGFPVAVADSRLAGLYPAVTLNHEQGSVAATKHLLGLGHRQVHHLAGLKGSDPSVARLLPWQRVLEQNGIRPPEPFYGDWSAQSGYEIGKKIAQRGDVTALYCANDEMAMGVLHAFHEAGLRVPEDISVVGFDDLSLSAHLPVPLTTVRQDYQMIGKHLFDLVKEQLEKGRDAVARRRVVVPTQLIVRSTTAAPRFN